MPVNHPWLRHARSRAIAACAAFAVSSSGLVATAPPAAAAEPVATSITASPGRASKTVGTTATFTFTLGTGTRRVTGRTVTIYTKKAGATRWDRSWIKTTNTYGQVTARFTVTRSTYVRANFAGDSAYQASQSINAYVQAVAFGTRVINEAATHAGKPYLWGATGPSRFDCSGFTLYVFGRFGKSLPHSSRQQYASVRHIAKSDKRVGDLIFTYGSGGIYHVGIYAGNGEMWHSPRSGKTVNRSPIWSSSYYVGRVA